MVGTKKRGIQGASLWMYWLTYPIHPPFSTRFLHPLRTTVFLLSHFSSLSLWAFLSCFNLLSFSHPTAASFLPTLPTQSFNCSASLSLLLHRRPYFSCTPSEQPGNRLQDDSGKWRDNPKDFQGFKVFVLAIIICTGCNYHKHTGSENRVRCFRNKDKHIVLHLLERNKLFDDTNPQIWWWSSWLIH